MTMPGPLPVRSRNPNCLACTASRLNSATISYCLPLRPASRLLPGAMIWYQIIAPGNNLLAGLNGKQYEIVAEFSLDAVQAKQFGFRLRTGNGPGMVIAYDIGSSKLTLDRGLAGNAGFG